MFNNFPGFIGKRHSVVEKLLRCCPDIGKIYMLVRPKNDVTPEERVKTMIDLPLFERVVSERGLDKCLEKLIPIEGNLTETNLGVSAEDELMLRESNIRVVMHSAATIRFFERLKSVFLLNIL